MNNSSASVYDSDAAYAAVGYAISQWSQVESSICRIFAACLSPSLTLTSGNFLHDGMPAIAFFATDNFRSKLSMTDRVLRQTLVSESELNKEILKCWQKCHNSARRLSTQRNILAHHNLIRFEDRKPSEQLRLMPPFLSPNYHREMRKKQGGMSVSEIRRLATAFVKLTEKLKTVYSALGAHEELRSRFVGQIAALMENLIQDKQSGIARVKHDLAWPE